MTQPFPSPGERVRHAHADLAGVVERISGQYVRVKWDHYGLAVAALGTMADLQKPDDLRAENSQAGSE